jgi:hypothetical protein
MNQLSTMNFYEELEKYFATTPREKVLEDWAASKSYDNVGPKIDDLLKNLTLYQTITCEPLGFKLSISNNIFNPEFSSGFLFLPNYILYAKGGLFH